VTISDHIDPKAKLRAGAREKWLLSKWARERPAPLG